MVGKYVQIRDSYISLNEALIHGGLKTRTRVNIHYIESTDIEQHGTRMLEGMDAILVPGGFGERGIEGKIQAVRFAREHRDSLSRHLPRHADRGDRVCAPRSRPAGCEQHGVQPRHHQPRHRADHRMAGRRHAARSSATSAEARAARCVSARRRSSLSAGTRGARALRQGCPSSSAIVTASSSTTTISSAIRTSGMRFSGLLARRAGRDRRAAQSSVVRSYAVPPGVHLDAARWASAVHRLRAGGDARIAPRSCPSRREHEARRPRGRHHPALLSDRRAVRRRKRRAHRGHRRHAQGHHGRLGIPFIFKASYDKANRSSRSSYRGPASMRASRCWMTSAASSACRC